MVLDTSDNANKAIIPVEKELVKTVINNLMEQENRFGLVTFGSQAFNQFHLNSYQSINDITMAINYMWSTTGMGDIQTAITYTIENGFRKSDGDRPNIPNIILATSLSTDMTTLQLQNISKLLQQNMIEMVLLSNGQGHSEPIPNIHFLPTPSNTSLTNDAEEVMKILCKGQLAGLHVCFMFIYFL